MAATPEELGVLYKAHMDAKSAAAAAAATAANADAALVAALDPDQIYSPQPFPSVKVVNGQLVEFTPLPLVVPAS